MKIFAVFVACVLLTGCASVQPYKVAAVAKVSEFNDEVLNDAEFAFCRMPSIGAWVRRFGNDPEGAEHWRGLCLRGATETPSNP